MIISPLISVILPTYNRADFLVRSVRSIQAQSLQPGELILVDDGSTDNSQEIIRQLARESSFPVHVCTQAHAGVAAARNRGICLARFPYLCFLDSDDWWQPEKLAKQYAAMATQQRFLVSHTREIWYRKGVRVNQKKKHDPPHGNIFNASLRMCMVGMSTVMMKREAFTRFGLFNTCLPCCEDYDLWLRIAAHEEFLLVPEQLICKDGGREDQLSFQYRVGMDVYRIEALLDLLKTGLLSTEQQSLTVKELVRKCTLYGTGCLKHGRRQEGNYYLGLPKAAGYI